MISYQALREQFTKKLPAMLPQLSIKGFWLNHTVDGHLFDFVADVRVGQVEKRLLGGLQSKGEPRILRQAITELRESGGENADTHFIIVAPYLSERGREVCRRNRIGGVDLALQAADHYRALRRLGVSVRKTTDLLIGTWCIAADCALLHSDRDFDPMAQHLGLRAL